MSETMLTLVFAVVNRIFAHETMKPGHGKTAVSSFCPAVMFSVLFWFSESSSSLSYWLRYFVGDPVPIPDIWLTE